MEEISPGMNNNMCIPNSMDRLPDELLISIVSRLTMKDAIRTSILAHRWRYFWAFRSVLDFDRSQVNCKLKNSIDLILPHFRERTKFVNCVDRVLNLHTATTIDKFRISFDLDSTRSNDINRWLKFAFTKRVKRLELDLLLQYRDVLDRCYLFPNICEPIECLRIFPIGLSSCESLVTLRLSRVGITGEVLEFFISNCLLLEELYLEYSISTTSLRTSCPSMRLRRLEISECPFLGIIEICSPNLLSHLEIRNCQRLNILEICSPNLLSFTLWGSNKSMALKDVSSLINLSLGARVSKTLAYNFVQISRCLPRLETLMIDICDLEVRHPLPIFPNLPRLKKLMLNVWSNGEESLLCFAPLDAAPMLCELVLRMTLLSKFMIPRARVRIDSTKGQRHRCLEVLQIVGFTGLTPDVGLAQYVIEHAVSLKKVVLDCRRRPLPGREAEAMVEKLAREGVRMLQAKLSEGVELIVL